jgi:hypothetical protein
MPKNKAAQRLGSKGGKANTKAQNDARAANALKARAAREAKRVNKLETDENNSK